MKVSLTREELVLVATAAVEAKFGGKWVCETGNYSWPREAEFVQDTEEYRAAKEAERIESERLRAKWEAEEAAEKAAKTGEDIVK